MITLVNAQPDNQYLLWQVELQAYNIYKLQGHINNYFPLVGTNGKHSDYVRQLIDKGINIQLIEDTRTKRHYIPSVQPHILNKFFKNRKDLTKQIFYFDADVIFREMPDFSILFKENDPTWYFSDTIGYLGYNYIITKGEELFKDMISCVNISPQLVIENNNNSGGAQHIIKDLPEEFWERVELHSIALYDIMDKYMNVEGPIQRWTAGMWSLLWNAFLYTDVRISAELNFNWATTPLNMWDTHKILHMAGATNNSNNTMFYKAEYISKLPFDQDYSGILEANSNCSVKYVELINEYSKIRNTIKYI